MNMYQVEVSIMDGDVFISQNQEGGDSSIVVVSPEQVDVLCSWLKAAAESAKEE